MFYNNEIGPGVSTDQETMRSYYTHDLIAIFIPGFASVAAAVKWSISFRINPHFHAIIIFIIPLLRLSNMVGWTNVTLFVPSQEEHEH